MERDGGIGHLNGGSDCWQSSTKAGGSLDFFGNEKSIKQLFPGGMTKEKFTYQLSDHLPLWIQINTATEGFKLEQIVQG